MKIIEHEKKEEFYALGDKAGIDENQVNDLYLQCKAVYHEEWEPALRQALANKIKDSDPKVQEAARKRRVVPSKILEAGNLLYRLSLGGQSIDEALLDVVIDAAKKELGIYKETKNG